MSGRENNWHAVSEFIGELRNASRLAAYVEAVAEIYESGAWRSYIDATGRRDRWRAREFDYFLIACGADYADVRQLLSWDRARNLDLAAAMMGEFGQQRRTLVEASAAWTPPGQLSLCDMAARQGWTRNNGELLPAPVPARARIRVVHGVSKDERTRRLRREQLPEARRVELEDLAGRITGEVQDQRELRYLLDVVTRRLGSGRAAAVTGRAA